MGLFVAENSKPIAKRGMKNEEKALKVTAETT